MTDLKSLVKESQAKFTHYRQGKLWYETTSGFAFPVPISDLGDATISCFEKPLILMRYIRLHLKDIADGSADETHLNTH